MIRKGTHNNRLFNLVWLAYLLLAATAAKAEILVVLDNNSEIHQRVLQSIQAHVQHDNPGFKIIDQQESLGVVEPHHLGNQESPMELVVTIGSRALQKVLATDIKEPILSVLVPRHTHLNLMQAAQAKQRAVPNTVIYINQPIERQFALAKMLLPRAETAGILLGPGTRHEAESLRRSAARFGLQLNLVVLDSETDASQAIKQVLRGSDLIIAVYDPLVIKPVTAKWLLYRAYQKRLPLIAFSKAFLKAGAVAAVYSSPEDIGQQTAVEIDGWLQSKTPGFRGAVYPNTYSIDFNRPVAESLEIHIPEYSLAEEKFQKLLGEQK